MSRPADGELWVVRHGETAWSRTGQHTGRTDLPLTAEGRREARAVRRVLADRRFALVLSSPLSRAWETCRIAGYDRVARATDDLREWDYGDVEGRTAAEVRRERPGWTVWAGPVPRGETLSQVAERARRLIARAAAARGDVLLFGHGHILRVLVACWLGLRAALRALHRRARRARGGLRHAGGSRLERRRARGVTALASLAPASLGLGAHPPYP